MRIECAAALTLAVASVACTPQTTPSTSPVASTQSTAPEATERIGQPTADAYVEQRQRLVDLGIVGHGIDDPATIEAIRAVPRHEFVPPRYRDQAYDNNPLPIGFGQTISQPYIVALMTQELQLEPDDRVLEVGTGSGYQAAVLAEIGVQVYSIEIVEPLAEAAAERLERLGYADVQLRLGDGYFGWPEQAPFDAIIVTAAPDHVPQPLLDQLEVGGILVIPVGPVGGFQELWRVERIGQEEYQSTSLGGVRFVPLVREAG